MVTWKFWRALQHPLVKHPLYQRTLTQRPKEGLRLDEAVTLRLLWRLVMPLVFVSIFAVTPLILPLVVITPALLPVIVNWFSIQWTVRTGGAIAREREQVTYDLMALIPPGAFVASWMISSATVHRGSSFADLNTFVRVLAQLVLGLLGIALFIAIIIAANRQPQTLGPTLLTLTSVAALVVAFYLDYVQSAVLSGLVGMLAPTLAHNSIDVRAWGFLGYLFLQVMVYLATWLMGFLIIPALYQMANFTGLYADLSLPVLRVVILYFVREGIISGLWHMLRQRLNALPSDLDILLP